MQKLFIIVFLLLSSTSFAAKYGSAGCGLGSMIFEGDQTWWKQVLASSTNTTGMQTIAIALGTSNCDSPAPLKLGQIEAFIEANRAALAIDIAKGQGETVVGLSNVYGCSNRAEFGRALKSNYGAIFNTADSSTKDISHNINLVAASYCHTTASL